MYVVMVKPWKPKFSFGYCFGQFLGYQKDKKKLQEALISLGWRFTKNDCVLFAPLGCSLGGSKYKNLVFRIQKIDTRVKF